jgi:hypothetical protein
MKLGWDCGFIGYAVGAVRWDRIQDWLDWTCGIRAIAWYLLFGAGVSGFEDTMVRIVWL